MSKNWRARTIRIAALLFSVKDVDHRELVTAKIVHEGLAFFMS